MKLSECFQRERAQEMKSALGRIEETIAIERAFSEARIDDDLIEQLKAALPDGASVSSWVAYKQLGLTINGLQSFKEIAPLARIVAKACKRGFKTRKQLPESLAMKLENDFVSIYCYISSYSATCQRVQVGMKTVEQPVYEIQCSK